MKTKWSCYYCQENLPTQKMLSDHRREKHLDPEGNFLCKFCEEGERCSWSYRNDDPDLWRGYSAMCRCTSD